MFLHVKTTKVQGNSRADVPLQSCPFSHPMLCNISTKKDWYDVELLIENATKTNEFRAKYGTVILDKVEDFEIKDPDGSTFVSYNHDEMKIFTLGDAIEAMNFPRGKILNIVAVLEELVDINDINDEYVNNPFN